MDRDFVEEVFGAGGALSRELEGYEPRKGQLELARGVARAIERGENLLAEAPTGTGKSVAYLAPAIRHAVTTRSRALVVTANINLQEQLVGKDLPLLERALGIPFRFAIAKGRSNYLCKERLDETLADAVFGSPVAPEDAERWEAILDWSRATLTGDVSELSFVPASSLRVKFTTTADDCTGKACGRYEDCFANAARRELEQAHVIVTNYHLLFAHLAIAGATDGGAGILPPFDVVIFDEGHRAADIARDFFGFRITMGSVRWAARLLASGSKRGSGDDIDRGLKDELVRVAERFFYDLGEHAKSDDYRARLRAPGVVESKRFVDALLRASGAYERASSAAGMDDSFRAKLRKAKERCDAIALSVEEAMRLELKDEWVYFAELDPNGRAALRRKPIVVRERLRELVFESESVRSAIVASATLKSGRGGFDFVATELGAEAAEELEVDSPFDVAANALLVVPGDAPDPKGRGFDEEVARLFCETVGRANGRTLGLFTSFRVMRAARDLVRVRHGDRFKILAQGDAPKSKLIADFRRDTSSVLLGVESFWAGIDVPGESLSCVTIDRLPFPSPGDPILSALDERDRHAFGRHMMPRAIIAFRQGFGRLLRATSDRGVVVVFDRRIVDKTYGRAFVSSLPRGIRLSRSLDDVGSFLGVDGSPAIRRPAEGEAGRYRMSGKFRIPVGGDGSR